MSVQTPKHGRSAFVFAGGGTGGHIYPALAIIEQLRRLDPEVDVHILCSNREIDTKILSKEDVPFTPLDAMPLSTQPKGLIRFIASWGPSVRQTHRCIQERKRSNESVTLVAMGGFVAAPAARGAHAEKIPVVLINLDAVPGKANLLIAKKAAQIFTAAKITGHESWIRTRPIVRQQALDSQIPQDARASFGLDPDTNTLLITGGSQGASSITAFVRTMVEQRPGAFASWQVIHQAGNQISDEQIDELRGVYRDAGIGAWVERYIESMGPALSAANLTIARCGAGTVAECWAARVPSIFFPYPYHKDEHQKHNAKILVDAGAAIIFDDQIDPARNMEHHRNRLAEVLTHQEIREAMRLGYDTLDSPDGAQEIAKRLMEVA